VEVDIMVTFHWIASFFTHYAVKPHHLLATFILKVVICSVDIGHSQTSKVKGTC
jgi:hypothetical protein